MTSTLYQARLALPPGQTSEEMIPHHEAGKQNKRKHNNMLFEAIVEENKTRRRTQRRMTYAQIAQEAKKVERAKNAVKRATTFDDIVDNECGSTDLRHDEDDITGRRRSRKESVFDAIRRLGFFGKASIGDDTVSVLSTNSKKTKDNARDVRRTMILFGDARHPSSKDNLDDEVEGGDKAQLPLNNKEIRWIREFLRNPERQMELAVAEDEEKVKLTRIGRSKYDQHRSKVVTSHLSEDTFSFLISARVLSTPFLTSVIIVSLKATLFGLIGSDMFNNGVEGSELLIPPSVTLSVTITQFFAIFIAVATQDDLITSLNLVFEGYSSDLELAFVGAALWKWSAAVAAYFLEGSLGLFVTFLLVVTSHSVVELLLNFTAVEFVSLLDNVAFLLATKGFLGSANRSEAKLVSGTVYRVKSQRKSNPFQRILSLACIAFFLLIGWGIIFAQQVQGLYLPNQISVQFDDSVSFVLGTYSGSYYHQHDPWKLDQARVKYVSDRGGAHFLYCREGRFWTFSTREDKDPCEGYIARSSPTVSFDLTETMTEPWYATADTEDPRFYPMSYFHLSIGCIQDDDCGGPGHGTCERNECICNEKFFGIRCDYHEQKTCEKLDVDSSTQQFRGSREFSTDYRILRDRNEEMVIVYDHPVFISTGDSQHIDIMMYLGAQWVLFDGDHGFKNLQSPSVLEIADYFLDRGNFFHAAELINIEFVTAPVEFDTPADRVIPTNNRWFSVRGTEIDDVTVVVALDTVILCEICDATSNPCYNGNQCLPSGQCLCDNGATGKLCQNRPVGDGQCHPWFNDPAYDYDNGDCCQSTCISSEQNTCGIRNEEGKLETVNIGFPDCKDPASTCSETGCWSINSRPIPLLSQKNDVGLKSFVKMSPNGRIVALSEPALDAVRVFDLVDSRWVQRGQLLEGDRDSGFGRMAAISSAPGSVFSRRFGKTALELAILFHYGGTPKIRVFRWLPNDLDWRVFHDIGVCSSLGKNERDGCEVCTMDIGSDHDSVTVAVGLDNGKTLVFRSYINDTMSEPWILVATLEGHHASLSGDSHRLATAMQYGDVVNLFRIVHLDVASKETVLIPIDHHLIASHSIFDRHNGASIDYKGNASHIEKIQLSSDGSSLALAAYGDDGDDFLLHYTVSIDRITYDSSRAIRLPEHSESEKASGLTTIAFSDDSSVVAIRHHLGQSHDQVQLFEHKVQLGGLYSWVMLGNVFESVTPQEDFSISHDGTSVVFGGRTSAQVYKLGDRCNDDEAHFRLSITLDSYPANVTWTLQTVQQLGDLQIPAFVLRECDHCYNNNDRFGRKSIVEEVCIPKQEQNCLSLVFQAEHGFAEGSGFAALLDGVDLLKSEDSGTEPVVWSSSQPLAEECQLEVKECSEAESLLVLALRLDRHEEETSWDIVDSNYSVIERHDNYGPELAGTTVVHEVCIPKEECVALTLHDEYGDGSCCDYGNGGYSIWVDGEPYESGDGRFGSKLRTLIGASCPEHRTCSGLSYIGDLETVEHDNDILYYDEVCTVDPIACPAGTILMVVEMTHDVFPEEVSWQVYDSKRDLLGEESRYTFDDMTKTTVHQICVPDDQCLSFVFKDSVGDGKHAGRGYTLFLDGEEVVNRHQASVGRERINFGHDCPPTSPVTVMINFDEYPEETGWSIADSKGIPVIEVFTHTYNQEHDNVLVTMDLVLDEVFHFTMNDDHHNGICCSFGNGSYAVFMGDKVDEEKVFVAADGSFKSNITHYFLNSQEGIVTTNSPWQHERPPLDGSL